MADKKYRTTTVVQVFNRQGLPTGGAYGFVSIGTMSAGSIFTTSGSDKGVDGKTYLKVGGSATPNFTLRSNRTASSSGYYIIASLCTEQTPSATSNSSNGVQGVTATKLTGERVQLHNVTMGPGTVYTVKTGYTCPAFRGPGMDEYAQTKVYRAGQQVKVYATCRDDRGTIWAAVDASLSSWVQYKTSSGKVNSCFTAVKDNVNAPATKVPTMTEVETYNGRVTNARDTTFYTMDDAKANFNTASNDIAAMTAAAADCEEGLYNMQFVIGIPPKITPTADIQYMNGKTATSNDFGRCYTELFMAGNTVVSIQPCKVKYLPDFVKDERETFWSQALAAASGDSGHDQIDMLSGQLFEAQPDYGTYINSVNMLARAMSIYMNIGDKQFKGSGNTYSTMDYSWYRRKDTSNSAKGIWTSITAALRATAGKMFTGIMNDDTYMHFYATADGTSINENLSVSTRQTSLESLFNNNLAELAQEIQFLGGTNVLNDVGSFVQGIGNTVSASSDTNLATMVNNLAQYGGNYLKGGRMVFPQMLDDCRYDRSYTCSCRFISPSGDPEAIFLNCYLPLCYLLPYVLPQMLSDNMYTFPHLARVNCKGLFHCDLAAVTGLKIQRGGQNGTCWTSDGLPFEVDVSFDITPLYSKLMVTGADHPILFMSNQALHEYLGAMCGVSFLEPNLKTKYNVIKAMCQNRVTDFVPSMLRSVYDTGLAQWASKIFKF